MPRIQKIKFLIIHCSDTPDKQKVTADDIHNMHLGFGWDGIGYHKIICRDGTIENGRPEYWVGAHAYGVNEESLGVCLIGRNSFTKKQYDSLEKVLLKWKKVYLNSKILGHCEAIKTSKTCPNFDVSKFLKEKELL